MRVYRERQRRDKDCVFILVDTYSGKGIGGGPHASRYQIDKLNSDAKYCVWDDPYLWRFSSDQVIRRCVPDHEIQFIL